MCVTGGSESGGRAGINSRGGKWVLGTRGATLGVGSDCCDGPVAGMTYAGRGVCGGPTMDVWPSISGGSGNRPLLARGPSGGSGSPGMSGGSVSGGGRTLDCREGKGSGTGVVGRYVGAPGRRGRTLFGPSGGSGSPAMSGGSVSGGGRTLDCWEGKGPGTGVCGG